MKLFSMTLAAALLLGGTAHAGVTVSNTIYDKYDASGSTRTFNVTTHGTVTDVNVMIDIAKCDDPGTDPATHTVCVNRGTSFDNEMWFNLVDPNGAIVTLIGTGTFISTSDGNDGRIKIVFDDQSLNHLGATSQAGTFRPVGNLATFNGIDMFGTWTLQFGDATRSDPLEFFGARLDINGGGPVDVPEPASVAIMGLGLLGLGAARRARRKA